MRQTPPSSVRKWISSYQLSIGTRRPLVFEMPDKIPVQVTSMMALEPDPTLAIFEKKWALDKVTVFLEQVGPDLTNIRLFQPMIVVLC